MISYNDALLFFISFFSCLLLSPDSANLKKFLVFLDNLRIVSAELAMLSFSKFFLAATFGRKQQARERRLMKGFNIGLVEGIDVNRSLAMMVKKSMNILAAFKIKVSGCVASGRRKSLIPEARDGSLRCQGRCCKSRLKAKGQCIDS